MAAVHSGIAQRVLAKPTNRIPMVRVANFVEVRHTGFVRIVLTKSIATARGTGVGTAEARVLASARTAPRNHMNTKCTIELAITVPMRLAQTNRCNKTFVAICEARNS